MAIESEILKSTINGLEKVLNELKNCKIKKIESYVIKSNSLFNEAEEFEIFENFEHINGRYIYIIKYLGVLEAFNEIKETYEAFNTLTNQENQV